MSKISLQDATSLTNEQSFVSLFNENNATIETASDNFLSLDGTSPNEMAADLDMNSFEILNIGDLDMNGHTITGLDDAVDDDEPVTLGQLSGLIDSISETGSLIKDSALMFTFDGNGTALTTSKKAETVIPFGYTISKWYVIADQSGSIVFDIWVCPLASSPPTVANTITGSAKPTLSSVQFNSSSTLTGWTTSIAADSAIRVNIDSATTLTRATLILKMRKAE